MKYLRILSLVLFATWALSSCSSEQKTDEVTDGSSQDSTSAGNSAATDDRPVGSDAEDFATFFNEALVGRSEDNIEAAIGAVLHPERGVYLIHKPGAIPKPDHCQDIKALEAIRMSILSDFTHISSQVKEGELPFFNCDMFDKEGAFYKQHENNQIIEKSFKDMAEMMYVDIDEATYEQAKQADAEITHTAVSTNSGLQLGFGKINGKWYLLLIDIAVFDCGA